MNKTRKPTSEPVAEHLPPPPKPLYSEADILAIVTAALQVQSTYQPLGFALPVPDVYGVSIGDLFRDRRFDAWARFDLTDGISFTMWIRRDRQGEWRVTVNPSVRLGEQDARGAETYATAFAIAARAARMVESMLRVDVTVHHPTA